MLRKTDFELKSYNISYTIRSYDGWKTQQDYLNKEVLNFVHSASWIKLKKIGTEPALLCQQLQENIVKINS